MKNIIQLVYIVCTFAAIGWVLYDPSIHFKDGLQALSVLIIPMVAVVNNLND